MIELNNVSKTFTLHNQNAAVIGVLDNVSIAVAPGECVALVGNSGSGKSTLMRMIYGNYLVQSGSISINGLELVGAQPRQIIRVRREILGYVSQFLRVVPRVPTIDVVAEPLLSLGVDTATATIRAAELLARLNIPETLWSLSPTTFSGGEQQRVNIARGFAHAYPAMLLDEPTASLDAANRDVVLELIEEAKQSGTAILGIFHDELARKQLCNREIDVLQFSPSCSA